MALGFAPTDYFEGTPGNVRRGLGQWGEIADWGVTAAEDILGAPDTGADHIPEQNRTAREFEAIDAWLGGGPQTAQRIDEAIRRYQGTAARFFEYATQPQFGERGRRGAFELRGYAEEAVLALQAQKRLLVSYREPGADTWGRVWGRDLADLDPELIPGVPNWMTVGGVMVAGFVIVPRVLDSMRRRK